MKNLAIVIAVIVIAVIAHMFFTQNDSQPINDGVVSGIIEHGEQSANAVPNAIQSLISTSPAGADVFFLEPGNGSTVSSPVTIKFGISNMTVAPAGQNIENSGHHHLLINIDELPDMTKPLPATENIIHFGGGQTETTIELSPGTHSLQLLLGNYLHIPHDAPVISRKITIEVE